MTGNIRYWELMCKVQHVEVSHFSEQAMHDGIHSKMLIVVSELETVHVVGSTPLLASVCLTDAKFVEVTRRGGLWV